MKKSPSVIIILLVFLAGLAYAVYMESDSTPVPEAVSESFTENDARLQIHYIDVGQGDSSLILFGETSVLIDAGERDMGGRVSDYLDSLEIENIDYIIATHPHSDHIGGLPDIINNFNTGTVIAPRISSEMTPTTKTYENFLVALRNKGKKITAAKAGQTYTLESEKPGSPEYDDNETAVMEIIAPLSPQSDGYDDLNDFSVVMRLTYKDTSYLFTGDASRPAEDDILESGADISADVLKVSHHGSSSASTEKFLEAVSPDICIIQCGADNSYGHPNKAAVERLDAIDAEIYRNDLDGTVIVYSDGEKIVTASIN